MWEECLKAVVSGPSMRLECVMWFACLKGMETFEVSRGSCLVYQERFADVRGRHGE